MRNRYFIYKQNKRLAEAGIIAIMLVIFMLAFQWRMPLKKDVVEGNGWEMALPINYIGIVNIVEKKFPKVLVLLEISLYNIV